MRGSILLAREVVWKTGGSMSPSYYVFKKALPYNTSRVNGKLGQDSTVLVPVGTVAICRQIGVLLYKALPGTVPVGDTNLFKLGPLANLIPIGIVIVEMGVTAPNGTFFCFCTLARQFSPAQFYRP